MCTHGVASNIHRGIKISLQSKHLHISPVWFSSSCLRVNCRIIAVCRQATSQASGPWFMWKVCRKGYTPVLHLFTLLLLGNNNTQSYHLCFECFYIWSFLPAKELNNSLLLCRADHDRKLPGEHDDTMRNFVLAQALPAVSYQLLVFRRQLLHATSGCNNKTSSSTPLNDQLEDGHSIRGNAQTKLLPIHLQNKVEHQVSNLLT